MSMATTLAEEHRQKRSEAFGLKETLGPNEEPRGFRPPGGRYSIIGRHFILAKPPNRWGGRARAAVRSAPRFRVWAFGTDIN